MLTSGIGVCVCAKGVFLLRLAASPPGPGVLWCLLRQFSSLGRSPQNCSAVQHCNRSSALICRGPPQGYLLLTPRKWPRSVCAGRCIPSPSSPAMRSQFLGGWRQSKLSFQSHLALSGKSCSLLNFILLLVFGFETDPSLIKKKKFLINFGFPKIRKDRLSRIPVTQFLLFSTFVGLSQLRN